MTVTNGSGGIEQKYNTVMSDACGMPAVCSPPCRRSASGADVVSGFKEIRFVCGRAFPSPGCRYQDFDYFMRFLRLMCVDVKVCATDGMTT